MTRTERILVCCSTGCIANGAYEVARALEEQIAAQGANAQVDLKVCRTGCSGECEQGPLVRLMPRDTMYCACRHRLSRGRPGDEAFISRRAGRSP